MSHPRKNACREALLEEALETVEYYIARARVCGMVEATALVIERGDRLSRAIADRCGLSGEGEAGDSEIRGGTRPFLLAVVPWWTAWALLAHRSPERASLPPWTYPLAG